MAGLYATIDSRRFRQARSALAECDARDSLDRLPLLEAQSDPLNDAVSLDAVALTELKNLDLDVLLNLGRRVLRDGLSLPRFGTWAVRHGGAGQQPGLRDFATQRPTTDADLLLLEPAGEQLLGRTRVATDPISLRRGMDRLYWQSVQLVMKELRRLHRERSIPNSANEFSPFTGASRRSLSSLRLTWSLAGAAGRDLRQRARDRWSREQWFLAYRFRGGPEDANRDLSRFHQIKPPPDRMWADPFIVTQGDRACIFLEELVYAESRGVLAVIEADRDGNWTKPRRILERPYHLSYPCVFSWNEEWYMVPESHEDGTIQLFRAAAFPDRWELAAVLMKGIAAVDTTLFEWASRWWMLTSTAPNGRAFNQLLLFHAGSPFGPWIAHPQNPVVIDVIGGRCAGRPFMEGGKLYRAAQNNCRRYGHAMEIRELVTLTPERFGERAVASVFPDWDDGLIGTHTLNTDGEATVIDGLRRCWRR